MSLSPMEMIEGLGNSGSFSEIDEDECPHPHFTGSHPHFTGSDIIFSADDAESVISFTDSMSIDSDTLQDFGSMVSLPPGTLAGLFRHHMDVGEDGAQTILSSAPSSAIIPPPEASQDVWALSPHPTGVFRVPSFSTVSTDSISYQRLLDARASGNARNNADENLIVLRSERSNIASNSSLIRRSSVASGHDPVSFVAIANRLMRESVNIDDGRNGPCKNWYSHFSEQDWNQFHQVARMILASLEPPTRRLALPPSPPQAPPASVSSGVAYRPADILTASFVCPLCSESIVGAFALDCGCEASTVCSPCWAQQLHGGCSQAMVDDSGFVWVEQSGADCPTCHATVHTGVPCHALDVAILQIVQNLPNDDASSALKANYYKRLRSWREQVIHLHDLQAEEDNFRHDEMLARLIQEEENLLWKGRGRNKAVSPLSRKDILLLGLSQTAVALIAATVASVGLQALARR
jgi:hypothetical protein